MAQYRRPDTRDRARATPREPPATNLVINGDFEAGTLTGWTGRESSGHTCGSPSDIAATQLAPPLPVEAALLITLAPGPYTAVVTGVGGSTVGLIEVYEVAGP